MSLSKSISRQLARIERRIEEAELTPETASERHERQAHEEAEAEFQVFVSHIHSALESLDEEFFERVCAELEDATREQVDIRHCGEFKFDNGLSLLTNAVLSLAHAQTRGRKVPISIPHDLCAYFAARPLSLFLYRNFADSFCWLDSGVSCQECRFPVPARGAYFDAVPRWCAAPGECEELPFKRCPACGGGVTWNVSHP